MVPLGVLKGGNTAPFIVADVAEELHALCLEPPDILADIGRLQRQYGPGVTIPRHGFALRGFEADADTPDFEHAPIVALAQDPQAEDVPIEAQGTAHVLRVVIHVADADD